MKKFVLFISLLVVLNHSYAQNNNSIGVDCNPKLNEQEISYLGSMFSVNNFDFKNKNIGFAAHKVKRICRGVSAIIALSMSQMPINKKEYFTALAKDTCRTTISKLLVLNEEQKKESGGFDAIVLLISKKKEKKIDHNTIASLAEVFGYRTLNYPDNVHLVGNDNMTELTDEDAVFFNTIYHYRGFNFKGKKIAFMNPHLLDEQQAIRTKKEYIGKIKKHLNNDFLYPTDDLEVFNEQEKRESGGYDAMIIYQTKRFHKNQLIQILKENGIR